MKNRLLCLAAALVSAISPLLAGPRDALWQQVENAEEQGLPKTAITCLEPIITGALSDRAYDEAINAIARKIALEGSLQGNKAEEKIVRLQAELEPAPAAMKPMMEALLAHWYWQYYQQNRWRFLQRTQTAAAPGPVIQTWDLARILAEIDLHFSAALAHEAVLKQTPIRDYDRLLDAGNVPDAYRPTLFDFLAYEALEFYQAGEHGSQVAEDEFEIEATSPVFADVPEFLAWKAASADAGSTKLKAIQLYQSLLEFHRSDKNPSAFFDADLARLGYGHNVAVGETKDDLYQAALERFITLTARHEISARASTELARLFDAKGERAKAREVAERAVKAFPKSVGGTLCFNLIQEIGAPSAQLETEHVWNAPWPTLDVTYRNITKVFFRAVPVDFNDYVERSRWGFGAIDNERRTQLLAAAPVLEWDADLPATADFKERTEKLPAPTSLKPGFYIIVASHDRTFAAENNQISAAWIWVSKLAMVMQQVDGSAERFGFVLDASSGEPIAGATIRQWARNREGWLKPIAPITTDANGRFALEQPAGGRSVVALAEHEGQAVSSLQEVFIYPNAARELAGQHTVFFTDRSIYRPGQMINYKGVSIRYDHAANKYSAEQVRKLTVVFRDPNGQEIARADHTTSDHGSFSGEFTAPRDRVMGAMSIQVLDGDGSANIQVEEYKRPKFQVELKAPVEAAKLDAPVVITGKATAYTGVGIGGAKVKWRVERGVELPYWCWWWQPPATKAIAHGTALTEPDGTFRIEFPAQPDRSVPAKNEPVFVFRVHADVTDTTGETRTDQRAVRSGYTALSATLSAEEWQTPETPVELAVATTSLDGDAQPAEGTVTIHALKQPATVARTPLQRDRWWWRSGGEEPKADPTNPDTWELGDVVAERAFTTDATGKSMVSAELKPGIYRASLTTRDRFGRTVTARETVQVVEPSDAHYGVKLPNHFSSAAWTVEPGETFSALWGTGYEHGRAFVELECRGKPLKSYWTAADRTQALIDFPVRESMRGGFTVRVTYVRENRAYFNERVVNVPWSNKQLSIKWESFRSKLMPGAKETWTAVVTGPDAKRASAEMVAALYDASLDQFLPHDWPHAFDVFRAEWARGHSELQNGISNFQLIHVWAPPATREALWRYRSFPEDIVGYGGRQELVTLSAFAVSAPAAGGYRASSTLAGARMKEARDVGAMEAPMLMEMPRIQDKAATTPGSEKTEDSTAPKPDLSKINARKNLNETAFFFPRLVAGDDGVVKMEFTMPEALTEWKFLGFAHDQRLRSGWITAKVVTAKDLMVEPNPPRFVREGDAIAFTVKVSNQTDQAQTGTVRLTFADAATQSAVDTALGNRAPEQGFDVPAHQSRSYSWRVSVPDGLGFLTYKAVAATANASDGEEGFLPVLSRRVLVTESLPLPIRGPGTKQFEFKKLLASGSSDTLRHQSLTVQMTSQPAWYAVMALPYLMEYPYECSEQVFNRFYANSLARHLANSDPKIRRIFDLWKNIPALDSPLEKNQELKSVMLEETPWLRQAKSESQARRQVGLLFDANRLDEETARVLRILSERQVSDGLWSWFPGGRSSEYISLYIMTGFGRLRHLGVDVDSAAAVKSLGALDAWMDANYRRIMSRPHPEEYIPSSIDALYLYGRSFFLAEQPVATEQREAIDFYLKQARTFWLKLDCRQSQAQLALALHRFGDQASAEAIVKSLKERSVSDDELGMFWRDTEQSWWWYRAPIETQAMMIEAFAEVTNDAPAVEDCKVWLLKQKQTQDWKTTKATADAIYGLLLRGKNLLASDAVVEVALAGEVVKPKKTEAGTGFYEKTFAGSETKPAMGHVSVTKTDDGVSWGSVHWQYLEDVAKVTPHEGTPLKLKKTLWVKRTTGKGQVLEPVTGPLSVGDELVVRLELRTDRDMEFVHLKDQRGSGTEPVSVLSQYHYQDGLAYYESTRDTATHFFIDYLPKGVYVFEYSTRIQLRGRYQSGIAEIQCMYAPEFNSHSESVLLEIQ